MLSLTGAPFTITNKVQCMCIYVDTSVCLEVSISNVIPESLDICPPLHLKQISQSSGITLLIHTSRHTLVTTCRIDCYMFVHALDGSRKIKRGGSISIKWVWIINCN